MVLRLIDRQNYTSLLSYWFTHGSPVFLLFKCPPILIIYPGEVNIWGPSQSGNTWISIETLGLPVWTLYITEKEVWRIGHKYLREVSIDVYLDFVWKYSPLLPLLPFLNTWTFRKMSAIFIDCCHTHHGDSRTNLYFYHKIWGGII